MQRKEHTMNASLTDILWYSFIGAMFFMMIRRGGCCGGHRHKKEDSTTEQQEPKSPEKPLQ
jgi:hypothetical protein